MQLRILGLLFAVSLATGCAALRLAGYALFPDPPEFEGGEVLGLEGLRAEVEVARRSDGLWRVSARDEHDAILTLGYLQARDRMTQLDLLRHLARGELAALFGNQRMGERTALDFDRLHRFLGFREQATRLYEAMSREERELLDAFAAGVNHWISEGHATIEHRLLGIDEVRFWSPQDSLAIYQFITYGLSGNSGQEVRRLAFACASGLDALERIWPTNIEFEVQALPNEDLRREIYPPVPAVAEELREELPSLCTQGAADRYDPVAPAVAEPRHLRGEACCTGRPLRRRLER
jgi:acyl-homoserine lactone acylase PvdQ